MEQFPVLVVDSDLKTRQVVADCLEKAGFAWPWPVSAEEALQVMAARPQR